MNIGSELKRVYRNSVEFRIGICSMSCGPLPPLLITFQTFLINGAAGVKNQPMTTQRAPSELWFFWSKNIGRFYAEA